jgi:hypothetical protein
VPGSPSARPPPGRLVWLAVPPPAARGNGLAAVSWVPLLDLDEGKAQAVLEALRVAGVAACVARRPGRLRQRARRETVRVWVDVPGRTRAEDVLRGLLTRDPPASGASRAGARRHAEPPR